MRRWEHEEVDHEISVDGSLHPGTKVTHGAGVKLLCDRGPSGRYGMSSLPVCGGLEGKGLSPQLAEAREVAAGISADPSRAQVASTDRRQNARRIRQLAM
jgi:hypothetical protein